MTNTSPQDFIEYIKKLSSECSRLERSIAVESIVTQLRGFEQSPNFPDVFEELRPDNFSSTTKTLTQYQREILTDAINAYCK